MKNIFRAFAFTALTFMMMLSFVGSTFAATRYVDKPILIPAGAPCMVKLPMADQTIYTNAAFIESFGIDRVNPTQIFISSIRIDSYSRRVPETQLIQATSVEHAQTVLRQFTDSLKACR